MFLDAYTKGDNRLVVATDTMKNFIHAVVAAARARTLEEWLLEVGTAFLDTYPHMERLTMLGRDLPFPAAVVPAGDGDGFEASDRLFSRDRCDAASARLDLARDEDGGVRITDHESGRRDLQLIKITGSAFADFARDEHTTLPERPDRPLYIWMRRRLELRRCVRMRCWRIRRSTSPASRSPTWRRRLPRVRQPLDPAPCQRDRRRGCSTRWPQLAEVSFDAQNRLWDLVAESSEDPRVKTYGDPRPPFGHIGLVLRRD